MDQGGGNDQPTEEVTETVTITREEQQEPSGASNEQLVLHLTQPAADTGPRVSWATDTVDNEFMQKKKSKCCCVYKKPKRWDAPSDSDESDSDCETDHCRGHVEKRHDHHQPDGPAGPIE